MKEVRPSQALIDEFVQVIAKLRDQGLAEISDCDFKNGFNAGVAAGAEAALIAFVGSAELRKYVLNSKRHVKR